jgi:hypothetical protein
MFDAALTIVATRMAGFDEDHRQELVSSTRELAAERSRVGRAAEVVFLAGLALRLRARRTPRLVLRGLALGGVLVVAALASFALTDALAVRVAWAAVVPTALVAAGWFDARYAAAAAVVWLWRFLTADPGSDPDPAVTFLRLAFMAAGVFAASTVTRLSLRRLHA